MLSISAESFVFQFATQNIKIRIYRTLILPLDLYGCETWSLTLREKHRLRVFENRVLRKVFRPERDEVKGEWRKLQNEGLDDLYSSPSIFWVIKSKRKGWEEHITPMRERRNVHRFWWGNLKEDPGVDGRKILRWIFRKWVLGVWTGWIWLRIGTGGGHLWLW